MKERGFNRLTLRVARPSLWGGIILVVRFIGPQIIVPKYRGDSETDDRSDSNINICCGRHRWALYEGQSNNAVYEQWCLGQTETMHGFAHSHNSSNVVIFPDSSLFRGVLKMGGERRFPKIA